MRGCKKSEQPVDNDASRLASMPETVSVARMASTRALAPGQRCSTRDRACGSACNSTCGNGRSNACNSTRGGGKPALAIAAMVLVLVLELAMALGLPSVSYGITPDVRLPEWSRVQVQATAWQPTSGQLTISVRCSALLVDIRQLSATIQWPPEFNAVSSTKTCNRLASGQTHEFSFTTTAPKTYRGWLEIQVAGLPDPAQMQAAVRKMPNFTEPQRRLVLGEVRQLRTPLPIGGSYPLLLTAELAALTTEEFIMQPALTTPLGQARLWLPVVSKRTTSAVLAKEIQAFRTAVGDGDLRKAESAAALVMGLLARRQGTLALQRDDQETPLEIKLETVRLFWQGNLLTLAGVRDPLKTLPELQQFLPHCGPAAPFLWSNLSLLHRLTDQPEPAAEARQQALALLPAWPGLQP